MNVFLLLSVLVRIGIADQPLFNKKLVEADRVVIKGSYPGFAGDKLELIHWQGLPDNRALKFAYRTETYLLDSTGDFIFSFKVDDLSHISLIHKLKDGRNKKVLSAYVVEPGDDITIHVKNRHDGQIPVGKGNYAEIDQSLRFIGKGSEKYTCQYQIRQTWERAVEMWSQEPAPSRILTDLHYARRYIDKIKGYNDEAFRIIDQFEEKISPPSYQLLKADVFGENMGRIYRLLSIRFSSEKMKDSIYKNDFLTFYRSGIPVSPALISETVMSKSTVYPTYLLKKVLFEHKLGISSNGSSLQDEIASYTGLIRERLWTEYLITNAKTDKGDELIDGKPAIDWVLENISDTLYKSVLRHIKNTRDVGAIVHDFQLPDLNGVMIKLSDYKGKVVFLDFWFTGCAGCKQFYKNILSKAEKHFENNDDVVFISVSIDVNRDRWMKSVNGNQYTSPLAVNLYTGGKGADHIIIKQLSIRSFPALFVIDRNGTIFNNDKKKLQQLKNNTLISTIYEALRNN